MIRVGTSGWSYAHWANTFYPEELPRSRWSEYYRSQFPVVELNATFYHLPRETTVGKWLREAAGGFRYVVKASRYITHIRRLKDCAEPVDRFLRLVAPLQPVLLAVLWQLPPTMRHDDALLTQFLGLLPRTLGGEPLRHAVEFRHPSWVVPAVHEILAAHDATNVWVSSRAMPADMTRTSDFAYVRFHGLDGGWEHDYTTDEMAPFADALRAAGTDGVAFFNNDGRGHAPANARTFIQMLGPAAFPWPPSGRAPESTASERSAS